MFIIFNPFQTFLLGMAQPMPFIIKVAAVCKMIRTAVVSSDWQDKILKGLQMNRMMYKENLNAEQFKKNMAAYNFKISVHNLRK